MYRECSLECSCALGTNWIAVEQQRLQRLVLAANQTQTHLDNAHYQSEKIGWPKRNVFLNESSFTSLKSDVRQNATDRGSASIANLVDSEAQLLQGVVLAANQTQTHLDRTHYQSKKIGWRKRTVFMYESSCTR